MFNGYSISFNSKTAGVIFGFLLRRRLAYVTRRFMFIFGWFTQVKFRRVSITSSRQFSSIHFLCWRTAFAICQLALALRRGVFVFFFCVASIFSLQSGASRRKSSVSSIQCTSAQACRNLLRQTVPLGMRFGTERINFWPFLHTAWESCMSCVVCTTAYSWGNLLQAVSRGRLFGTERTSASCIHSTSPHTAHAFEPPALTSSENVLC